MSTPSFDDIKTSTEKAVGFIEWLAEVLRSKNWVTKLLLLDVIIFAVFNPLFFSNILKLFIDEPKLPGHYKLFFWFGVLCGESGCGKTSFLQAGLIPRLKGQYQCVYVKLTDLDPVESIRPALIEQAQTPKARAAAADFFTLLELAVTENSKNLVLFFDQFEQFFVHHKLKEQREPFVKAMARWYNEFSSLTIIN